MSDKFSIISIEYLLKWILEEEKQGSIFGISKELFFKTNKKDPFRFKRYGQLLETPLGVAAGPHTQMAQNIIAAWLTGARYIELKTIQTLDELEVSKPCIDMEDAGYNCEWSQELKLEDSFNEYLNAWIIIHILQHKFKWKTDDDPGHLFNMSIGYNYEGILKDNVQKFLNKLENCSQEKNEKIDSLVDIYPALKDIDIPDRISNNVTLSTMHGCPPEEIEKIGLYLINEKKLHTTVKLNPTLLGPEKIRDILNNKLGFETNVPDEAFEHDLKYDDSVSIIKNLQKASLDNDLNFSLKLTNTLESVNHRNVFPENEKMMYMSGKALHPISINLAAKLQDTFNGDLDISFSAGADAFNFSDIISCNIKPVTICSDILRPGGYGRLLQYIDELRESMSEKKSNNFDEYILSKSGDKDIRKAAYDNLKKYAENVIEKKVYKKSNHPVKSIKTERELGPFDCIKAPCVLTCPSGQDVPDYMYHTSRGEFDKAFDVIMQTNPFPTVCGMVCDHLCMTKCTRLNYDDPLLIREIKRFVASNYKKEIKAKKEKSNGIKVAVIGSGPSGLACAYFLAQKGFLVNVYETKNLSGGMVSSVIPSFRLSMDDIKKDVERIEKLGVEIHYNSNIDKEKFLKLKEDNDYIYIAVGAQEDKKMNVSGDDDEKVIGALSFLSAVKRSEFSFSGKKIAVVGGGNSAMDAARTAYRLLDSDGEVTIVYRRTREQMPADKEEVDAAYDEGVEIIELVSPEKIMKSNNKLKLVCSKMKLGEPDESGRKRPVKIDNEVLELEFDLIISAIGQEIGLDFIDKDKVSTELNSCKTNMENVYIGGDALHGPANIITAIGDGKKVCDEIVKVAGFTVDVKNKKELKLKSLSNYQKKSAKRINGEKFSETDLNDRKNFNIVINTLDEETAMREAERCLYCNDICNVCVTVCPNRANVSYLSREFNYDLQKAVNTNGEIELIDDSVFIVDQEFQVFNIADFCNECGNCWTFCPTSGAPYKDKPKICLTEESFSSEKKAYFIFKDKNFRIQYKDGNELYTLTLDNKFYLYETEELIVKFNRSKFTIENVQMKSDSFREMNFKQAAQMSVLLDNLKDFYLFN